MMESNTDTGQPDIQLWQFVPIEDYILPAAPVTHTVKKGIAGFRRLFSQPDEEITSPLKSGDELRLLPDWQLNKIAPPFSWDDAVVSLDLKLTTWLKRDENDFPVCVLVGPPHSGYTNILEKWADLNDWNLIKPPSSQQIFDGDASWLTAQIQDDQPWVFPWLEKAYLRHAEGLPLIRQILDLAYAGRLGRGVLGCDSWAWSYLGHVWRGKLPYVLTLQAFDRDRLSETFQRTASVSAGRSFRFRQADDGKCVLPNPDLQESAGEMSSFLQLLAAFSRGNLGVALAGWRSGLRKEPDEMIAENVDKEDRQFNQETIWVTPWDQLVIPALPGNAGHHEAFVLQSLLLHNGLSLELLQQLLPLAPNLVMETLIRLKELNLTEQRGEIWQVTRLGYPVVREFLQSGGYLVDQF